MPFTTPTQRYVHSASHDQSDQDEDHHNLDRSNTGIRFSTYDFESSTPAWQSRYARSDRSSTHETSSLLSHSDAGSRAYHSIVLGGGGQRTPGVYRSHKSGASSVRRVPTSLSRTASFSTRLVNALSASREFRANKHVDHSLESSKSNAYFDNRVWYDQFTSTDWVHDNIADAYRMKELKGRRDFVGRVKALFDAVQGWILVAIIGGITAFVAYFVTVVEGSFFDIKTGYCNKKWYLSKKACCDGVMRCDDWVRWSEIVRHDLVGSTSIDYAFYVLFVVILSMLSCLLTLPTKTVIPSAVSISTLDEDFAADNRRMSNNGDRDDDKRITRQTSNVNKRPPVVYYSAAGSGVAEIKVIVSGFVLHGYLGVKTLIYKTLALILSIASGLSVGKEGPFVHIATCVGNIASRLFPKYHHNDAKRREALSASAASGVAVAFGAPIGGVLFSLEEVSYYFPPKTLFRTFFCCIVAALTLKFLNPYGTGKIVLFEVRYLTDWEILEMAVFILLGVLGGFMGAMFIKAARIWAMTFRRIPLIKKNPLFEVFLIALVTGVTSWWNRYTRIPVTELLFELATPCSAFADTGLSLCATQERIPSVIWYLGMAFIVKAFLTTITFGIKVPAGIYVPSMVCGGLLGRMVGHIIQYLVLTYPKIATFGGCDANGSPESCVVPGVYAMVAAGATMCGVTRLSVTLAVILFELTGSLDHVLPFSIGVLVSKWTADAIEPLSIYDLLTDMNSYPFLDNKVRPIFTTDLGDMVSRHLRTDRTLDISNSPLLRASEMRSRLGKLQMAGELDGGLPILKNGILVGLIPAPDLEFALDKLENEENSLCLMSTEAKWDLAPSSAYAGSQKGEVIGRGADSEAEEEDDEDGDDDNDEETSSLASNPSSKKPISSSQYRGQGSFPALKPSATKPMLKTKDLEGNIEGQDDDPTRSYQNQIHDPTDFTPYIDPAPVALDVHSPMDLVYECFVKLGLRYICVTRDGKYAGLVHKKAFVKYTRDLEAEQHSRKRKH